MKKMPSWMAALLVLAACATPPADPADSTGRTTSRDRNVLTAEEIATIDVATAADAVERLRPSWLRNRGAASLSGGADVPIVYVDDIRFGPVSQLQRIAARTVFEIRFIPGTDTGIKYGLGHGGGVIAVRTVR